jgi:ketosteroid isomerase-like protein
MTMSRAIQAVVLALLFVAAPATAEWQAASSEVEAAAMNAIDRAAMGDDPADFAALLADDLAVNNPQNGVSVRGATARRSATGQISYDQYDRIIEYAGLRGDMGLLMGEEIVRPREGPGAGTDVHRRFTDLWKQVEGRWRLTARQATVIARR